MANIDDFSPPIALPQYPNTPGVYLVVDDDGTVLYVGSSNQLCRRVAHLNALQSDSSSKDGFTHLKAGLLRKYQDDGRVAQIRFLPCADYRLVERNLIRELNPLWNRK